MQNKLKRTLFVLTLFAFFGVFLFNNRPSVKASTSTQLLTAPWHLVGNNGAVEKSINIASTTLAGNDSLSITYDLHGTCLLGGDASAVVFDQPSGVWRYVSLSDYGKNCLDGVQTAIIPLSKFSGLSLSQRANTFHVRFWHTGSYTIDVTGAALVNSTGGSASSPAPTSVSPTPTSLLTNTSTASNILSAAWNLTGNSGAVEKAQPINVALSDKSSLRITYNLNGLCLLDGDASAIILDQPGSNWHFASLKKYGQNCLKGDQTADIPLTAFAGLNTSQPATNFHVRFWAGGNYSVNIKSAAFQKKGTTAPVTPTVTPAAAPTVIPTVSVAPTVALTAVPTVAVTPAPTVQPAGQTWAIQSVSSMKETKDKICGQDDQAFINQWVDKAAALGVNYIAVETPYDNPSCADATAYAKKWIDTIRSRGLKVWHRHMPLAFEGIYSVSKSNGSNYLSMIGNYIKNNPSLFVEGDIFSPIPEPQNGGISGITYCAQGVCQFSGAAQFNQWLRDAIDTSNSAFSSIGLGGKIKVGYYGFDGFVAWGSQNPDWDGILEDATVQKMGNITIDHYPELINDTMTNGLSELHAKYPNTPIIIGEWGSTGATDQVAQVNASMGAAKNAPYVVGFNYWHMGMGGNEALINSDFTNRPQYATVQSFFKGR